MILKFFLLIFLSTCAYGQRVLVPFLAQVEGFRTDAYCMSPTLYPAAGVTIGIGVDFGSKTATSLRNMGVSEAIITKVTPYFGKTGSAACTAVSSYKLVLTTDEAMDLSAKVINYESNSVATRYNNEKDPNSKSFDSLTCAQRTVICSVLYQYGSPTRVPKFWSYVKTNAWTSLVAELRNFGDAFASRRFKEADLIEFGGAMTTCPGNSADICEATRGACVEKLTCTKKLISNFCQTKAASVMCCV